MLICVHFRGCPLTPASSAVISLNAEVNGRDESHLQFGKRETEKVCHSNQGAGFPHPKTTQGKLSKGKFHLMRYLVVKRAAQGIRVFPGEFGDSGNDL